MTHATTLAILAVLAAAPAAVATRATTAAPAAAELTALLKEFLAGASRNDAAVHERFWADDLVYTRAAGQRIGKADILRDVRVGDGAQARRAVDRPTPPRTSASSSTATPRSWPSAWSGPPAPGRAASVDNYLNTGTFVKRGGRWQAVAWQATKMPAEAAARPKPTTAAEWASSSWSC